MPPRWCAHALAPIHKEAKSATIGHSRKAAEALTAHAARAEYDRSGGVGIPVAGSLNPGSFSSAPRMPTLGEYDLRSSTRSAFVSGAASLQCRARFGARSDCGSRTGLIRAVARA